jgi:hypothetical protein
LESKALPLPPPKASSASALSSLRCSWCRWSLRCGGNGSSLIGNNAEMKLRFSIRDLLWLTLVCALLVVWWIDRGALERRVEKLSKAVGRLASLSGPTPDPEFIRWKYEKLHPAAAGETPTTGQAPDSTN